MEGWAAVCGWCGRDIPAEWVACSAAGAEELRQLAASPRVDPLCLPQLRDRGYGAAPTDGGSGA